MVRADGIDILVDLAGHTGDNRLLVLARKPAPVQVTWLGYPNTTGLAAVDYRVTDAIADPEGEPRRYTEELVRLDCFCCYAPPPECPAVSASPAAAAGHVTFASLHNLPKLNGQVLDLWCEVLGAVPTARMLVFRNTLTGATVDRVRGEFERRGVGAERLTLQSVPPDADVGYLSVYRDVDVVLDAFPWSGHTTTCEALWMGVPVVTLHGNRHAGRMGTSVLNRAGLGEWVAGDARQFVAIAMRAGSDPTGLGRLRADLRERLRASPLCDGRSFTRALEAAYRAMWQRWCAGRKT
jgi:predicted O-linked N-acetylglucosamine transferase (SPINDLY family)